MLLLNASVIVLLLLVIQKDKVIRVLYPCFTPRGFHAQDLLVLCSRELDCSNTGEEELDVPCSVVSRGGYGGALSPGSRACGTSQLTCSTACVYPLAI